jgi:phosphotransferase system HPr-like phosphotransfer protein
MQERKVTVSNRLGLHARAAARVVRRASILSVLLLAASAGSSLIIRAVGEDEERAANALAELVEQKFGEEFSDGLF